MLLGGSSSCSTLRTPSEYHLDPPVLSAQVSIPAQGINTPGVGDYNDSASGVTSPLPANVAKESSAPQQANDSIVHRVCCRRVSGVVKNNISGGLVVLAQKTYIQNTSRSQTKEQLKKKRE